MSIRDHLPFGSKPDDDDRPDRDDQIEAAESRPVLRPVPDPPAADTDELTATAGDTEPVAAEDNTVSAGDQDRPGPAGTEVRDDQSEDQAESEDQSSAPVAVDPPVVRERLGLPARARAADERSPVLAPWLKDPQELRFLVIWLAGFLWHKVRYHGVRVPLYLARLAGYSPRGLARTVRKVAGWLGDAEAAPLRRQAVDRNAFDEYMHLAKLRRDRAAFRAL
ncbi:MAG: hypothetical protein GEV07_30865, partial [Streptosporangiales bacterium]|nr:hypothetical protein [Streptosporangiales bacterium]